MNKLSTQKRMQVVAALVEGSGINSVSRMTGVGKPTILRLLASLGIACMEYQDRSLRNLSCKRIQVTASPHPAVRRQRRYPGKDRGGGAARIEPP